MHLVESLDERGPYLEAKQVVTVPLNMRGLSKVK